MKKWLIRIAGAFFGLFILVFLGLFFLLGTESGANFLVSQAEKLLGNSLQIGETRGKILDRLELSDILYTHPTGIAKIDHLVLDWKSTDLLKRHLHILEFTVDDISYSVLPGEVVAEPEESNPVPLPELTLPITITIAKLAIQNFRFSSAPDAEEIAVHKAELALFWDTNGITIQKLDVTMDAGNIQAKGVVKPIGNYPLQLTTTLKTLIPDFPAITMVGTYTGDLQKLKIQEEISGDLTLNLDMTLQNIIANPVWQGDIQILELCPAVFAPEVPGIVTGKLASNGNLKQAEITSTLSIRDNSAENLNWDLNLDVDANLENLAFAIKQFTLNHATTAARIDLTGTADLDQKLDINLNWKNLQWPVLGTADYYFAKGEATLKGTLDDFHLILSADMAGDLIPAGKIQLSTDGNTERLQNLQLRHHLLDGEIDIQGALQWSPIVKWNIDTEGKAINPGKQYPDWPGKLDWKVKAAGRVEEDGVFVNATINALDGQLRDLPVTGTGIIKVQPDSIHIQDLYLASGNAVITAEGNLGDKSALHWKADIADLSDLLPDASGQLKAMGTVQEKMAEPKLSLELSGSSIRYSGITLEQIEAKAALDISWASPFSLTLNATNLKSGDNLIKTIGATGNGSKEKHSIKFELSHDMADITLGVQGGYTEEKWQGLLDKFDIVSTDFGTWQLQEPAKISGAAKSASIDTLCLNRENSDLCVKGSWDGSSNTSKGDVKIHEIPLAWLSPWFPETLDKLTGLFSVKATATMQDTLQADVIAEITPGEFTYLTDKKEGTIPHEGMQLTLKVLDEALDADFHLSVNSNTVSGKIQSPNLLQKDIGSKAKLDGTLLVEANKFDLVEALFPEVKDLDAVIDLNFTILGTIEAPDINGKGQINIINMHIPAAGLDLTGTTLDILADNKEIHFNGKFVSPEGNMLLDGNANLDSSKNWPARLSLKGDNFRLINLPEFEVFLSSDLLFEKKEDLMSLTGEVTIPKADILLRDLPPGSQSVSPDVVIVQEIKEEKVKSPFHMQLKLSLGNKVHFVGFGLNAYIDGQLTILSEPEEQMIGSGAFHIKQGSFRAYGQDLEIETGVISFPGGPITQPGINLRATRTVGDIVAGIYAIGPASKPRLTTFSNPPMSESNVISYLLTGTAPNNSGQGTKLSVGRQINSKLSVSVGTDVKTGESEFITRYRLSRKVHVQTTTGGNSNAADIFYTIELEDDELPVRILTPSE